MQSDMKQPSPPDRPRLTSGGKDDRRYVSLCRAQPRHAVPGNRSGKHRRKPEASCLYLLHGGGGGFHDWSNYSDVAGYAERGLILVMPEGNSSYYTNSADHPQDRYEDYIVHDLIADVEQPLSCRKWSRPSRNRWRLHGRIRRGCACTETS